MSNTPCPEYLILLLLCTSCASAGDLRAVRGDLGAIRAEVAAAGLLTAGVARELDDADARISAVVTNIEGREDVALGLGELLGGLLGGSTLAAVAVDQIRTRRRVRRGEIT